MENTLIRVCTKCKEEFLATREFFYGTNGRLNGRCKTCVKAQIYEYYKSLRPKALEVLGGKCAMCGFSDTRALQIDHINNDGYIERGGGHEKDDAKIFRKIIRGDVDNYQILCANCNMIKASEAGSFVKNKIYWKTH